MADRVRAQLTSFWQACRNGDVELAKRIQREDDKVDWYNRELIDYLSHIGGEKNARDTRWQVALMNFTVELEAIGDLLDKHLCDLVIKHRAEGAQFPAAEWRALEDVYQKLLQRFDGAVSLFSLNGDEMANAFVAGKRTFNEHCHQLQQAYYARLQTLSSPAVSTNTYFLDYLNGFRRINSHLTGVAYGLAHRGKRTSGAVAA